LPGRVIERGRSIGTVVRRPPTIALLARTGVGVVSRTVVIPERGRVQLADMVVEDCVDLTSLAT